MIDEHVKQEAERLGINPNVAQAVLNVESGGRSFNADDSVVIRFEPHIFDPIKNGARRFPDNFKYEPRDYNNQFYRKSTGDEWRRIHASQEDEYAALTLAENLTDADTARSAISMGAAQIMGFNHGTVGYASPSDMFNDFHKSREAQISAFFRFLENRGLIEILRNRDFRRFAEYYNGPGNMEVYSQRMAARVAELEQGIA